MSKILNPALFSEYFKIEKHILEDLQILDPTLNLDIPLFIDPLLLSSSAHQEIRETAKSRYDVFFIHLIKLLRASKTQNDIAWRNAKGRMHFSEIKGTCLGYGSLSISGSGSGSNITSCLLKTAKEIVDLGTEDPDFFLLLGLFEKGFGSDRISDMVTNIMLQDLVDFNHRILKTLNIPTESIILKRNGYPDIQAFLPMNPFVKNKTPVLLLPLDILKDLPIVKNWGDIASAASKNQELRNKVNTHVGDIWHEKSRKDQESLKRKILSNRKSVETALELIKQTELMVSYNSFVDPKGIVNWPHFFNIADKYPCEIPFPENKDIQSLVKVVEAIIEQFRFLIEDRRISEELYGDSKVRPEKSAQRLFYMTADSYCKANNIDIIPEADTGNGPVDFKFSTGYIGRIVVEIKLSNNPKIIDGYKKQLPTYMRGEMTEIGYYLILIVDEKDFSKNHQKLLNLKNNELNSSRNAPEIRIIDGKRRPSASHL